MSKTVKVRWQTTVIETYEAEIDADNWKHMRVNNNITDGLAEYECDEDQQYVAVAERDALTVDGETFNG